MKELITKEEWDLNIKDYQTASKKSYRADQELIP